MMSKEYIGSDFDDFLKEEGIREEVTTAAIKRAVRRRTSCAAKESIYQVSILRSGTRSNSLVLFVTSIASRKRA